MDIGLKHYILIKFYNFDPAVIPLEDAKQYLESYYEEYGEIIIENMFLVAGYAEDAVKFTGPKITSGVTYCAKRSTNFVLQKIIDAGLWSLEQVCDKTWLIIKLAANAGRKGTGKVIRIIDNLTVDLGDEIDRQVTNKGQSMQHFTRAQVDDLKAFINTKMTGGRLFLTPQRRINIQRRKRMLKSPKFHGGMFFE